jgi:phosphoribosylformylglycinamidine synthase PurS subunit
MTYRAEVRVMVRRAILDPQGRAVEGTLRRLGFDVGDVRIGKHIELVLSGEREEVEKKLQEMVTRILSNPVMEEASYSLEEVVQADA